MAYFEIRAPRLKPGEKVGAGDVIKGVIGATIGAVMDIEQCDGCRRRQQTANRWVAFRGRRVARRQR